MDPTSDLIFSGNIQSTPQLQGPQRELFSALAELDQRLGDMYRSALLVLQQDAIPCRMELAAHALRELIDLLPSYIDAPQPTKPQGIKSLVNEKLAPTWNKCSAKSQTRNQDKWDGPIDKYSTAYLKASVDFFVKYSNEQKTRYERGAALVQALEPAPFPVPSQIEELKVQQWQAHYRFFAVVAHFNPGDDFNSWLEQLERFLLESLNPMPFESNGRLDAIIEEAERR